jgi:hypothetical protein
MKIFGVLSLFLGTASACAADPAPVADIAALVQVMGSISLTWKIF